MIPIANNPATEEAIATRAPVAINDAQHDPRLAPVHDLMRRQGASSILLLPLVVRDTVAGTIGLDSARPREFSREEVDLAGSVAAAASQVLEKARADEALRQSEERLKFAMEAAGLV